MRKRWHPSSASKWKAEKADARRLLFYIFDINVRSDLCEEALLTFDFRIEDRIALAEVIHAYNVGDRVCGIGLKELCIHILAAGKPLFVKNAAVLARIERSVKRSGLDEILEEVAAVAKLWTQSVRAVRKFGDAVEAVSSP